jgi:hypothetical protein
MDLPSVKKGTQSEAVRSTRLLLRRFQEVHRRQRLALGVGLEGELGKEVGCELVVADGPGGFDSDVPMALGLVLVTGVARQPSGEARDLGDGAIETASGGRVVRSSHAKRQQQV